MIKFARILYVTSKEEINLPIEYIKIKTKNPPKSECKFSYVQFNPSNCNGFIRNETYKVQTFLCHEVFPAGIRYEACYDQECEHKILYLGARIIALGATIAELERNSQCKRKSVKPVQFTNSSSELEYAEQHLPSQMNNKQTSKSDRNAAEANGSRERQLQPEPTMITAEANYNPDLLHRQPLKKGASKSSKIVRHSKGSSLLKRKMEVVDSESNSDCEGVFLEAQRIMKIKKEVVQRKNLTLQERSKDQLSRYEKKNSSCQLPTSPQRPSSRSSAKLLNHDVHPSRKNLFSHEQVLPKARKNGTTVGYDSKELRILMSERDSRDERYEARIAELQAMNSRLTEMINMTRTAQVRTKVAVETSTPPAMDASMSTDGSSMSLEKHVSVLIQNETPTSSKRKRSPADEWLNKRKAEYYSRGYGEKEEGKSRPRKYVWALKANADYYYKYPDGDGFQEYKRRYTLKNGFVFLAQDIWISEDEWQEMKEMVEDANYLGALHMLNLAIWEDDDFGNRMIEPEQVNEKDYIPGRGPVLQLQFEKLRLMISIYKDLLSKLIDDKSKRSSSKKRSRLIAKAPQATALQAKRIRQSIMKDVTQQLHAQPIRLNGKSSSTTEKSVPRRRSLSES